MRDASRRACAREGEEEKEGDREADLVKQRHTERLVMQLLGVAHQLLEAALLGAAPRVVLAARLLLRGLRVHVWLLPLDCSAARAGRVHLQSRLARLTR